MTTPRPIWQAEYRVADLDRSMAFYAQVFDWEITRTDDDYAMIDTGLLPLLSLMQIGATGLSVGVCHFVQSADCTADARRASELGGRVIIDRSEVPGSGFWTDTLDAFGNELGFWQAEPPGAPRFSGLRKSPLAWVELGVADLTAGIQYYERLLGWRFELVKPVADYAICTTVNPGVGLVGGERGARLRGMTDYFPVADLEASCARVRAAGGQVLRAAEDLGDGSLFTICRDPDGHCFGLVQPALTGAATQGATSGRRSSSP